MLQSKYFTFLSYKDILNYVAMGSSESENKMFFGEIPSESHRNLDRGQESQRQKAREIF